MAPEGTPLDMQRFLDVASPEGVVVAFEAAWPGDFPIETPCLRRLPVEFPDALARPPPPAPEARRVLPRPAVEAAAGPALPEPATNPAADRPVLEPRFDALVRGAPEDVPTRQGVAAPFATARPPELPAPEMRPGTARTGAPAGPRAPERPLPGEALQPPEYLGSMGGPAEMRLLEAPPPDEPKVIEQPPAPDPPGFASPQMPQGKEPRAPGQAPCTTDPFFVFPPVEPFLFTPERPQSRGAGGPKPMDVVAGPWVDPCPCVCICVHSADVLNAFVLAGRLPDPFIDLFKKDTKTLLGVSARPAVVIATPGGFVEHVRDVVARRDLVGYGAPRSFAPGSAAPADGLAATFATRTVVPASAPRLLWPELDGTLGAGTRTVAPVGPGPGLPGIGSHPLVPASGSPLRAAPGSLPAGIAPANDGFEAELRGRRA